jgi:hypothetical protein
LNEEEEMNMNDKILLLSDEGWDVATSNWTAAAKPSKTVSVCYVWSPRSGMGFIDQATGVARTELALTMEQFLATIAAATGHVVDLRHFSKG